MIVSADAAAKLLLQLAHRDPEVAEHSIATARWSGAIARSLGLDDHEIAQATMVGALHEVGLLRMPPEEANLDELLTETEIRDGHRALRAATVAVISDDPAIARFASATGSLYDDIGHSPAVRCAIVADQFEALVRHMPGMGKLRQRDAVAVLQDLAGSRFDRAAIEALIFVLRRTSRENVRPA